MKKKTVKNNTKARMTDSEKRMKPLVDMATKDARHFVAQTMQAMITATQKFKTQKEADDASVNAMNDMFDAFCRAQCSAWRMMLAQMVEEGFIDVKLPAKK